MTNETNQLTTVTARYVRICHNHECTAVDTPSVEGSMCHQCTTQMCILKHTTKDVQMLKDGICEISSCANIYVCVYGHYQDSVVQVLPRRLAQDPPCSC